MSTQATAQSVGENVSVVIDMSDYRTPRNFHVVIFFGITEKEEFHERNSYE